MLQYGVTPLQTLIKRGFDKHFIQTLLSSFHCSRNKDVVRYLENYALRNELLGRRNCISYLSVLMNYVWRKRLAKECCAVVVYYLQTLVPVLYRTV